MLALIRQTGSFLAQSPVPITLDWQTGLISLLLFVFLLLNIWDKLKRKPAIDEVLERKFREADAHTERKIEALDRRRETGEKEIRQLINDQVSQLEKFISKQITDNRQNHTEQFGFLRGELHAVRGTMQALSTEVARAIGRLEGADKSRDE